MIDKQKIKVLIHDLIKAIGDNPEREGLLGTPERVANMYEEIFSGVFADPKELIKTFKESEQCNEVILVKDIPVYSMCEHHLLPFTGFAHIAYIPKNGKIMGLSKFSRVVNCFSRRPQIQERLTDQIADFIFLGLDPLGVAVSIEAEHLCMTMRGIKALGSKTMTLSLRGIMNTDEKRRKEVLSILDRRI